MHVVILSQQLTSTFNTSLEFADRLSSAGHRVSYVTHADVEATVRRHGHGMHRLTGAPANPARLRTPDLRHPFSWMSDSLATRATTAHDDEIERAIGALRPDILAIDLEMHYATIAVTHIPVPAVYFTNFFSVFRGPDIPPMSSAYVPTGGPADERGIRQAWRRERVETYRLRFRGKFGKGLIGDVFRPISYDTVAYADVKAVARARNVDLRARTSRREWLDPVMFMDLPVLSFTAREMEFPHRPHPNMRYVGPMIPRTRSEGRVDAASEAGWSDFAPRSVPRPERGPIIYCSLGSYFTSVGFLQRVIEAFRRRPDWHLVLGLGGQATRSDLGALPPNVLALDWAPQLDVLAVADAAITHGGSSSIHECIANAVPMVVYPPRAGVMDQDGNAARVVHAGLGVRGDWKADGPAEIERDLESILDDRSMAHRLTEMQRVFERYDEDGTAVATLEAEYQARSPNA